MPEFLSDDTLAEVEKMNKEADELISEGKIEDVLFYFEKLDAKEKEECFQKIKEIINNM